MSRVFCLLNTFCLLQLATKRRRSADGGKAPAAKKVVVSDEPVSCYGGRKNCGNGKGTPNGTTGNPLEASEKNFTPEHLDPKKKKTDRRCHWCLQIPGKQRKGKRNRN